MKRRSFTVGKQVSFRFYNWPERKFYGPIHTGTILEVRRNCAHPDAPNSTWISTLWAKVREENGHETWISHRELR